MPIKILVVGDYSDYHISRPEAEIFKQLAQFPEFEIFIFTDKNSPHTPEFEKAGIKIIDYKLQKKFDKKGIEKIRNTLINNQIDVIHLFNSKAIYNGLAAVKNLEVKVVVYRGFSSNVSKLDPFANLKFLHPRIDAVMCNSIGVAEHLQRQLFFKKSKAVVIHKGHKLEWYQDIKPANIREDLGISPDALLLVTVANNRKMKGIPYLLKAMNELPQNADIHLLLVGRDMDDKTNLKIINKGDKRQKIHILGFRKDALNIVAAADVFVLPSIYGESLTKSVMEAMALGVAPVISDIRGNYELVENGKSGLVFKSKNYKELSEKILQLYNDRDLLQKLKTNAKQRIKEHFDSSQTVLKLKELYEDLIRNKQ